MAASIILSAQIYAATGGAVALLFLLFGIERTEPAARGAVTFRPLIVPGIVLLWPLVVGRWYILARQTGPSGDQ
ncbi:MAG: hypothetical protein AAGD23_11175 [Pseudomonadota bacterium]